MRRRRGLHVLHHLLLLHHRTIKPTKPSLLPPSHFPPPTPTVEAAFLPFIKAFSSSDASSPDGLECLIDPNDPLLVDSSQSHVQEFAFLRDSLVGSRGDDGEPPSAASDLSPDEACKADAVSIANAIEAISDGFGDETHRFLRQFRGKLNERLVIEVLSSVKNPGFAVKFFIWAGRQIGYSHTPPAYLALLDKLGSCGDTERVPDSFLRDIGADDDQVLRKLLNVLIRKCCRNGSWNLALEELGRLKDFGLRPSPSTYNALIQVFLRADRLDTAFLLHREMLDAGFRMDGYTMGCFAHSLCKAGKWREALLLIESEGILLDTVLYTKMISGLCEASLFDIAMDFLGRMRSSSCLPNATTYNVLLSSCLRKGQLGRCKRILNMMITEGCCPYHSTFLSLLHASCKSGDHSYAYKLLKKMVQCNYNPGFVAYNILIGGLCSSEESTGSDVLELAEKAYGEMLDAGIVLNKVNVTNFARCLCNAGKFEKAHSVIREMMSKGFIPDCSTYSKVISFLCNASKFDRALTLFEEMKHNGIVPDVYVYTILIDGFCKAGLIEQGRNWFGQMLRDGCTPNVVTYTALIHAHLKAKKTTYANELFQTMLSEGCTPNVVTYTALIDGHCKAGEIEKACQIFSKMTGNADCPDAGMYFRVDQNEVEEPNVYTYGALIDGLCKAHKIKEASALLDAMSEAGHEPNQIVYDALISGFCKVGNLDEAQKVFAKMSERGYSPNEFTYGSLIDSLFKDKRLDLVMKVLSRMLENSCTPNVVIYTEMIDGLSKVGKVDEAHRLMLMMEEKGCHPNVVTYTAMIDGFGKAGRISKCFELLKQMHSRGCAPNFVTYGVLIKHCCAAGLLDDAYKLMDEMKLTYWPQHMAGYRKVIEGFTRDFIDSLGLLDEMGANTSVPLIPVYRVLIDSFARAGRLEVALNLLEEIKSSSRISAGYRNVNASLIESLSLVGKVEKAFELYADFLTRHGIPEFSTFIHLIRGLVRTNRWEELLQLSYCLCQMDIIWLKDDGTLGNSRVSSTLG